MLLSQEENILFVHIQRTGGSTLRKILTSAVPDMKPLMGSHPHISWVKPYLGSEWDRYYKFAFVRNPWERILSWYTAVMRTQQGYIADWYREVLVGGLPKNYLWTYVFNNSSNFEEFLFNCTDVIDDIDGRKSFAYNQLDYISDENGEILVDFIGRYENYMHDLHQVFQNMGLDTKLLPHEWPSRHDHYSKYYNETTKQLVAERFARDIEFFGYEFEEM